MTKKVRIENADNSAHKVTVETWRKGANGEPDTLKDSREINSPTDLAECWGVGRSVSGGERNRLIFGPALVVAWRGAA